MHLKKLFLEIHSEINAGGNPNRRVLSTEETRIFNYRSGISSAIKQENRGKEHRFFELLFNLYSQTNFPLLSLPSTLLLFRKFNTNERVFDCLIFTINELGEKSFLNDPKFWEHFIHFIVLNGRDEFKSKKSHLVAFTKIAKLLFTNSNYENYNILFGFLLNHSKQMVSMSLSHYQLGSNVLGHLATGADFKNIGPILKLFSVLKKAKADPKVFEMFLIQFSNNEKNYFAHEEQFRDFITLFIEKFPVSYLLKLNGLDLKKLYVIYQINSAHFVNFDSNECENFKQVNGSNYGLLRSEIVRYLLKKYGISYFFIKNFNEDKLSLNESNWFNDVVSGKNLVYSENLPFELNKKLVHKFNTVSTEWQLEALESKFRYHEFWENSIKELSVREGLIWSAIVYYTKNLQFADTVTQFIRATLNTEFWVKVVLQLYRNGLRSDNNYVTEVFDYIEHQVFNLRRQINFKTKKIANLIEESNQWHLAVGEYKHGQFIRLLKLPRSHIQPFHFEEEPKTYIIRQILSNRDLAYEGSELGHCVGTYTNKCMNYGTFIFSFREVLEYVEKEQTEEGEIDVVQTMEKPMITIEVNKNYIVQKRGKKNRRCLPFEDRIIKIWAKENSLIIRAF
jgi:hypothetical protein